MVTTGKLITFLPRIAEPVNFVLEIAQWLTKHALRKVVSPSFKIIYSNALDRLNISVVDIRVLFSELVKKCNRILSPNIASLIDCNTSIEREAEQGKQFELNNKMK